ncbi:MAG: hypothetical protein HZC54_10615 [Verrucomicrobia bacterium]|nr:hypothetical protein [Verrucomicrobiota bacterium]
METKLDALLKKLKHLEDELLVEVHANEQLFRYEIRQRKVHFTEAALAQHQKLAKTARQYLCETRWLSFAVTPVIWSCAVPMVMLDLWVTAYQFICFPVYGIPKVRRADYVVMDRRKLAYLNSIESFNCVYCEYVNGLIAYAQEIAGRTEQYFCPIKHALRLKTMHSRYSHFLDYGDAEQYRQRLEAVRKDFEDLKKP